VTLFLGLVLAGLAALITQVGFLLRHRGAVAAPDVDMRRPLASAVALFRSRWWTIGYALAVVAYVCHVGALTLAAMSLVQAVLAGGLVLLGVVAERFFGFELTRRQWAGVILTAAGLAMLAISGDARSGQDSADYSIVAMLIFEAAVAGLGVVLILCCRDDRREAEKGILLGLAAGLLFTTTHVAVKALSGKIDTTVAEVFVSPYLYLALLGGIAAFFASARSLQIGPAVPVIAVTSIAGNASAIPAGMIVFGDPLGRDTFEVLIRTVAFLLVIGAAALIPAPTRAARIGRRHRRLRPLARHGAPEQQRADHGHDGRDERDREAHHAHEREHEAHDRDRSRGAPDRHEPVGALLARPARGRSA
jgi:drug/metabolite transporter (DMT)-like permease